MYLMSSYCTYNIKRDLGLKEKQKQNKNKARIQNLLLQNVNLM